MYDPTCGAGDLLTAWGDIPKFGQDVDSDALTDAEARLTNFTGVHGDTLADPAFMDKRFHLIVANPPFSIRWEPTVDERFLEAPTIPTKSKADYAFILHILHLLADDGVAVVMGFPGILYRGAREGKIRAWMVEENVISTVVRIPGGKFEDTAIETCILVLKKHRTKTDVQFIDLEHNLDAVVPQADILADGCTLSVSRWVQPPIPEAEQIDEAQLQAQARAAMLRRLKHGLAVDAEICSIAGFTDHHQYLDEVITTVENHRKERNHRKQVKPHGDLRAVQEP